MLKSRGGGLRHSLLSPETEGFTHFTCIKKVNAPLKPEWGGAGVSNDWCIRKIVRVFSCKSSDIIMNACYLDKERMKCSRQHIIMKLVHENHKFEIKQYQKTSLIQEI